MNRDLMYKIASGQIENPELTLEVDGEVQCFNGRDARVFAFGYLTGSAAEKRGINIDDRTTEDDFK